MNHVGFAPAQSHNVIRLTITALIAAGAIAVGLLAGPATASADSSVGNCNAVVNVVCVGQINGNPVIVNVGNIGNILPISGNNLNTLTNNLNNVFVNFINVQDINILAIDLTTAIQTAVNTWVNTITNVTTNTITKTCTALVTPAPVPTGTSAVTIACA